MKNLYLPVLLVISTILLAPSCQSSKKMIGSGQYDQAIDKAVRKLRRNRNNEKEIVYLKDAFVKAQKQNLDAIQFLKKEGQPENAVSILNIYKTIDIRQRKIKPLLPLYINGVEIKFNLLNVQDEIIANKKEAAGYLYSTAMQKMETGNRFKAREAYADLLEVKSIYPSYMDVDTQIERAFNMGLNFVQYKVVNASHNLIPRDFADRIAYTDLYPAEGKWFRFISDQSDKQPDFSVTVNLKVVDVGPEKLSEKQWQETKEIETGKKVTLKDKNGNVVKDSLGNAIMVPVIKEISAMVNEVQQTKVTWLRGSIDIYDYRTKRIVKSTPFEVDAVFDHIARFASGDINALKPETKRLLTGQPIPFPTDFDMIMDGASHLQPIIKNIIRDNRGLLES